MLFIDAHKAELRLKKKVLDFLLEEKAKLEYRLDAVVEMKTEIDMDIEHLEDKIRKDK